MRLIFFSAPLLASCNLFATQRAVCGDGELHPQEACDDGNTRGGDGCSSMCRARVTTQDLDATWIGSASTVWGADDLTGDGIADIVVGDQPSTIGGVRAGAVHIISGGVTGTRNLHHAFVTLHGDADQDLGLAVAAGDVDGDGTSDLLVTDGAGQVHVVFGPIAMGTRPLESDVVIGASPGTTYAMDLDASGDIDGDGVDDIVVGAPGVREAHVFLGPLSAGSVLPRSAADIVIDGSSSNGTGEAVAIAGDLDGNGVDDLVVGAPFAGGGRVHVFYGPLSPGTLTVAAADATLEAEGPDDEAGRTLERIGDVDGDGLDDLYVGAWWAYVDPDDTFSQQPGAAYVVVGGPVGTVGLDRSLVRIDGQASGDELGASASGGDVNEDGVSDLVIGARGSDVGGTIRTGAAYVFFGPLGKGLTRGDADIQITGASADEWIGFAVSAAGDHDGDGDADIVVGGIEAAHVRYSPEPTLGRIR